MSDQKILEKFWQQAFEQGYLCWDCQYCVKIKNMHPYGETHCFESGRDCSVRELSDCPAVQARLKDSG